MDEFSFFEVMNHWRTDKLDMSGSNNQFNGTGWGFMVPQKKLYDAFVQEEGVDGYRLNQTMKTYDQITQLGVKVAKGQSLINEGYFMWKRRFSNVESPAGFWCSYNNYRWMRYAEVLLLAAEANLKDGNQSEADACLNEVRQRARLDAKTATLDAIKLERDWNSVLNIPVIRILSVGKMRRLCLRIRVKEHLSCQIRQEKMSRIM